MNEFGLDDYAFQIEDLDAGELGDKIDDIIAKQEVLSPQIDRMQKQYQQELDVQYKNLIKLLDT